MAIGSEPEIGGSFGLLRDFLSWEHVMAWHHMWRLQVGDDLCGGYATVCYVDRGDQCSTIGAKPAVSG